MIVLTEQNNLQPQAREKAEKEGFEVSIAKTSFKANTKALAENEGEGLAKVHYFSICLKAGMVNEFSFLVVIHFGY